MRSARVLISGFVQGVGYRQFVRKVASNLNLKGWVKNLPDQRVEACFIGSKENIKKAILECKKGPFLAEIEDVEVEWNSSSENLNSFEIIR